MYNKTEFGQFGTHDPSFIHYSHADVVSNRIVQMKQLKENELLFFLIGENKLWSILGFFVIEKVIPYSQINQNSSYHKRLPGSNYTDFSDSIIVFGKSAYSKILSKPVILDSQLIQKLEFENKTKLKLNGINDFDTIFQHMRTPRYITKNDVNTLLLEVIKQNI